MDNELIKELEAIGLSEKEARVYLTVLEVGQATVQEIGKKADVNRATTYVILDSLMTKGLIATFGEGKKGLYIAEAPHGLNNIIREQEEELEKRDAQLDLLMPELHSLYNLHPNKPEVKFYEGKEGLKQMLAERRKDSPDEVRVFYPAQQVKSVFTNEEAADLRKHRVKKEIKIKSIISEGPDVVNRNIEMSENRSTGDQYKFTSDIEIWDDKILMASLEGHVSGVIIKSKLIADTMKSIFELAFEAAEIE